MTLDASPRAANLSASKKALLAQRLRQRATGEDRGIPRRPAGEPPPMSYAQERLWFMEQFAPGTAAYNIPFVRRLRGDLRVDLLRRAFDEIVARHETLRTRYPATDDGRPVQVVDLPAVADVRELDAADLDEAGRLVNEAAAVPFDVTAGPLLRVLLVRVAPDDHVLLVVTHHSISDGWSTEVLIGELFALYDAFHAGRPSPLPELRIQYGDFAAWQQQRLSGAALQREVAYWRDELAGVEPLELPTDRPRPAQQTFDGAGYGVFIEPDLLARLTALGRERGATLYMVLLAAFQVLLARHSGQREFAVGSPIAGRSQPETEALIGMFVNVLALRARLDGDPAFTDLLARTRETCLDAYAHQELPFAQLVTELNVNRDVRRSPIFQAVLAVQNYGTGDTSATTGGLTVEIFGVQASGSRFDLELFLMEHPDGLHGAFNYNRDLFDEPTVAHLATHLQRLLRAIVANPEAQLSTLDMMDPAERTLVLDLWNSTAAPFPDDTTLPALIAGQVARTPDLIAVTFERTSLTYRQLDDRAERLAGRLGACGAGPGGLVGVCAERSLDLVVGLLGVLKSGAAYVPLDPEYPADRLAFMLADAGAPVLLTQRHLTPPASDAHVLFLEDDSGQPERPPTQAGPDDTAYMIYTSGSTGRPKGVPNTHRGIVNRLDWMQKTYRLDATDVVLQKTPASFDVSVWEFFWPLLAGARLVLAKPGGHKDAAYLRDLIAAEGVTTTHFVPSMLSVFLAEDGVNDCTSLRRVICSGEELPASLAAACMAALPQAELWNLYGPTEAAIDVTAWRCRPGQTTVPIGAPIQNMRVYVLDAHLQPLPVGAPGELHLAGVGLALGYHDRPELTAEKFVASPYGRLYRTGDLARWRPDGTVEFLGRIDHQVKLRGLRIELGEIEATLRAQDGVEDAVVVVRDGRLVSYVVGEPGDLRPALKKTLPDYMVPNLFVPIDALPLTPNGKLDRKALPAPSFQRGIGTEVVAPATDTERLLAGIWRDVLGVDTLGVDDDFFDLGGHSLLATQVVARIRKEATGSPVSVMDLFKNPTIRDLAALVETPEDERAPRTLLHKLTKGTGKATLSFVCVPYGGGSAVVYQPLADALPAGYALWSVSIPGHDVGVTEQRLPFEELAKRCVTEILANVDGPIALYGHCGVGSALIVEIARLLEDAGRELDAVYIGAMFPFARPKGRVAHALSKVARLESLLGDRVYANWLTAMGADMAGLDEAQKKFIIGNMRRDSLAAEEYFTARLDDGTARLRAPIISVMGSRDPAGDFYQERYKEWGFLTDTTALVMVEEAGHFFLKYRADELAKIVTTTHVALDERVAGDGADRHGGDRRLGGDGWELFGVSTAGQPVAAAGPRPSLGRFGVIAAGQLVSMLGSAMTEFAIPIWIYLQTGSLFRFGLYALIGLVPGLLVLPLAGAIVDRVDRRRVMLAGDCAAGVTQAALLALLLSGHLHAWHLYTLLAALSVALTFQRLAYGSAVPQLVPKQYLGHANGIMQMAGGITQFLVPLVAVGLMAAIDLSGILILDVVSYVFAIAVVLIVRFPRTLPWKRRETLGAEIAHGFTYSWRHRGFRAMLLYFAVLNLFLSPLFTLITPLVLSFGTLGTVARVSVVAGLGTTLGGLAMGFWGGPSHRRMRGVLVSTAAFAACCLVTGLYANVWVVASGAFGMYAALTVMNGVYTTIIQVKVPQRFHGRVFAINTLIAWSTLPLGFAVIAPYGARLFEPLLAPGGPLAGTVGAVIGTGPGRGIGLMYAVFALAMVALVALARRIPVIGRFDDEVPDAPPDDLVGAQELAKRAAGR